MERRASYVSGSGSSEHAEQAAVVQWAKFNTGRFPELAFMFAIPNGAALPKKKGKNGSWYSPQAQKLKEEGLLPGVADLFLPAVRAPYAGLFIELKHGSNTLTDDQERFITAMLEAGYLAMACWEAEQAIEAITNYLEGENA